jgi:guanidinopropionase
MTLGPEDLLITPRFAGHVSFFRLPVQDSASGLDIAVCGVPFDGGSTNKTGARAGPRQVREMSHNHIRPVHPAANSSPFTLCRAADIGDAPVNPLDQRQSLDQIAQFFQEIAREGAHSLAAGGDHLVSLPILRGIAKEHGPLALIHFDSHTDTYDSIFHGTTNLDNGTPFRRAVEEKLIDPKRSIQIGIRGPRFGLDDLTFSLDSGMRVITIDEYFELGPRRVADEIHSVVGPGKAYLSFDVDALDAVFVPGTGAPEIGGFSTRDAQVMLRALDGIKVVGGDVVEVCPALDPSGGTALVAANLMFEIFNLMAEQISRRPATDT